MQECKPNPIDVSSNFIKNGINEFWSLGKYVESFKKTEVPSTNRHGVSTWPRCGLHLFNTDIRNLFRNFKKTLRKLKIK